MIYLSKKHILQYIYSFFIGGANNNNILIFLTEQGGRGYWTVNYAGPQSFITICWINTPEVDS